MDRLSIEREIRPREELILEKLHQKHSILRIIARYEEEIYSLKLKLEEKETK